MGKVLTIIIPAYNMEKYLVRCLSSLLIDSSFMQKFEVLVVNDGSKDRTSEIAHRFEKSYPDTFRVIDKKNGHYGSCINRGLVEAKGTFVKILDADDSFNIELLSNFIDFLSGEDIINHADVVLSDFIEIDERGRTRGIKQFANQNRLFTISELSLSDRYIWFIHGLTYRTALLRQIAYVQTEGKSYTDLEWAFIPMAYVNNIAHFPHLLYRYSVGREDQSINDDIHANNLWMEVVVIERILDYHLNIGNRVKEANRVFLSDRLRIMIIHIYELYLIAFRHLVSTERLEQFDNKLRIIYPELYGETEACLIKIGGVPFRFIRNWRHHYFVRMWIQNALYSVANGIARFRKRYECR